MPGGLAPTPSFGMASAGAVTSRPRAAAPVSPPSSGRPAARPGRWAGGSPRRACRGPTSCDARRDAGFRCGHHRCRPARPSSPTCASAPGTMAGPWATWSPACRSSRGHPAALGRQHLVACRPALGRRRCGDATRPGAGR